MNTLELILTILVIVLTIIVNMGTYHINKLDRENFQLRTENNMLKELPKQAPKPDEGTIPFIVEGK
jgi:uncharacterized protein YxeA